MDMFLWSFVASLCLLAVNCALARGASGARTVFWLSAGLVFLCAFFLWISMMMHAGVTAVLMLLCREFRPKPKTVMLAATVALVASYGILFTVKPRLREVWRLRQEFPFASLSERLAYEQLQTHDAVALDRDVERRLAKVEESSGHRWGRGYWLELLHSRTVGDFVLAEGFGNARMRTSGPFPENVALPESAPVSLPQWSSEPAYDATLDSPVDVADEGGHDVSFPRPWELRSMHEQGALRFVDLGKIGFVKDRNHVAGFSSHRFTEIPQLSIAAVQKPARWRVVRLELVSLLKHETPVAYVSKNLPRMDELRDAPTRPLDPFERQAVDRLRTDEDVLIEDTADRIRMVGSLRAARNCLDCHSVRRGELLGALTYELVPVYPARKKRPPVDAPSS